MLTNLNSSFRANVYQAASSFLRFIWHHTESEKDVKHTHQER